MSSNQKPRGFTLIELLVVVAIIALLISILLPSLKRAKDAAKAAVCLSHLKDIGSAAHEYATEDEREIIMPFSPIMVRNSGAWLKRCVMWYSWGGRAAPDPFYNDSNAEIWINEEFSKPYFGANRRPLTAYIYPGIAENSREAPLFQCPADVGFPQLDSGVIDDIPETNFGRSLYDIVGNSFRGSLAHLSRSANGNDRFSIGVWGQPIAKIENASEMLWGGDPVFYNLIGTDSSGSDGWPEVRKYGWHGEFMAEQELYADGGARLTRAVGKDAEEWLPSEQDARSWGIYSDCRYYLTRGPGWQIDCYPTPGVNIGNFEMAGAFSGSWPFRGATITPPPADGWD